MAIRNYVPVDVSDLPETFTYDLDNNTYKFTFDYNDAADFFTCTIADEDENVIISNEKLILGESLFDKYIDSRLPLTPLVPLDESGQAKRVSITNFGLTVQLYEDTIPDDYSVGDNAGIDKDWSDGNE